MPDDAVLRPSGTLKVVDEGAVIEGLDVHGCIRIRASGVTVRRTRVSCAGHYGIYVEQPSADVLIEEVEIDGGGSSHTIGVAGSNFTLRRALIRGVGDGVRPASNVVVEHSRIHDLAADGGKHVDGIQSTGGRHLVVRGNEIEVPAAGGGNSAIILKTDLGPIDDVTVVGNELIGGNYTVYVRQGRPEHGVPTRVRLISNRFGGAYRYGHLSTEGHVSLDDNAFSDDP